MMATIRKAVMACVAAGAIVLGTATAGFSAPSTLPAGTVVKAALASGTDMTFKGQIDGIPLTVSCTTFSGQGKIPSKAGYSMTLQNPPTISGCTDSLGGTDTIKTNDTNGKWKLTVTKSSPYRLSLVISKAGAVFTSTVVSGCSITAFPNAAGKVTGAYSSSSGSVTVTNASIATSGSGCSSTAATTSATIDFTPNPGAPPF